MKTTKNKIIKGIKILSNGPLYCAVFVSAGCDWFAGQKKITSIPYTQNEQSRIYSHRYKQNASDEGMFEDGVENLIFTHSPTEKDIEEASDTEEAVPLGPKEVPNIPPKAPKEVGNNKSNKTSNNKPQNRTTDPATANDYKRKKEHPKGDHHLKENTKTNSPENTAKQDRLPDEDRPFEDLRDDLKKKLKELVKKIKKIKNIEDIENIKTFCKDNDSIHAVLKRIKYFEQELNMSKEEQKKHLVRTLNTAKHYIASIKQHQS